MSTLTLALFQRENNVRLLIGVALAVNCEGMNTLPLSLEYLIREIRFLYKSRRVENTLLSKIHDVLGKNELLQIFINLQLDSKSIAQLSKILYG